MGEYQRLPDTVRKATELIRKGDMNVFRLVEDGVFDAQGNARYNADLDKVTHYGYDGERLEKIENRRLYLNYADIPENVRKVFLDWEDTRFYKHAGVDFPGMARAFINNAIGGRRQGASTITMQLVKILFLTGYPRTIKYRLAQMYLALVMERHFTKEQILELYFNSMFFGNHTYGVGAAARLSITSLKSVNTFAHAWRKHWGIENGLHYCLDVSFNEDHSRIRKDHAPENLAVVRHLALSALKQLPEPKRASIKRKRKICAYDLDYLSSALDLILL